MVSFRGRVPTVESFEMLVQSCAGDDGRVLIQPHVGAKKASRTNWLFCSGRLEDSLQSAADQACRAVYHGGADEQLADGTTQGGDGGTELEDDVVSVLDNNLRGDEIHSSVMASLYQGGSSSFARLFGFGGGG